MANGIRTGDPSEISKGHSSKFRVGFLGRQTPEEGGRTYRPKRRENKNTDEDNSPKTLHDKNHQASSQKFRQLVVVLFNQYLLRIMAGGSYNTQNYWSKRKLAHFEATTQHSCSYITANLRFTRMTSS